MHELLLPPTISCTTMLLSIYVYCRILLLLPTLSSPSSAINWENVIVTTTPIKFVFKIAILALVGLFKIVICIISFFLAWVQVSVPKTAIGRICTVRMRTVATCEGLCKLDLNDVLRRPSSPKLPLFLKIKVFFLSLYPSGCIPVRTLALRTYFGLFLFSWCPDMTTSFTLETLDCNLAQLNRSIYLLIYNF